jgi:RimJ/RimL family protein N-acetyltransferase
MILATGAKVRLRNIGVRDLKTAAKFPFTLSVTEALTDPKRLRVLYDRHGFWTQDAGAVAIEVDDHLVGTLQFYPAGATIHGYELNYVLHDQDDAGKGYASEALRVFCDLLFAQRPACHRLQMIVKVDDDRSARLAEACRFASEGVLRKARYAGSGEAADGNIYSMVRD